MRIRRGLLFWGLFLIPMGVVPLLARAGIVPDDIFSDIWRWWPLILIGIGIALLLGRSQAGLIGTALVALIAGTLVGSVLASGNLWVGGITECGSTRTDMTSIDQSGTFSGDATLNVDLDCGRLDVTTAPGRDWQVQGLYRGPEPRIEANATSLSLRNPSESGIHRQEWTVTAGLDVLRNVNLSVNAAAASVLLPGGLLSRLDADVNAGDLLIDGSAGTIDDIDASVNAGRMRVTLSGPTSGDLSVNAGAIDLCVPPDAQLRLEVEDQFTFATSIQGPGLTQDGDVWTRAGSGPAIDLSIQGNAASFTLDPEGGCK